MTRNAYEVVWQVMSDKHQIDFGQIDDYLNQALRQLRELDPWGTEKKTNHYLNGAMANIVSAREFVELIKQDGG